MRRPHGPTARSRSRLWKTDLSEPVRVARVLRPHGVRGAVILSIDHSLRDDIRSGLEVEIEGLGRLTVVTASPHKTGLLVQFDGVDDRDTAERASGKWASVERKDLPATNNEQFYDFELLGAEVKSTSGGYTLGRVCEVITTGANDVYRTEGPAGELLIPAIEGVVLEIDAEAGLITVDPAGLVSSAEKK